MNSIPSDVKTGKNIEFSPAAIRGGEVFGSLVVGAIGGYFVYGLTCLVQRAGMIDKGIVLQPIPYVLSGIVSASIVETGRLVCDAAFYTLGDRGKYENLANPTEASAFDHLRQKTWTIIKRVEGLQKDVDKLYSNLFNIRTADQVRADFATKKDYYLKGDPRFMEVFRRAVLEQVDETIKTSVPQELSIYAVEAMGYSIFGGHLFVWLYAVIFINGLMSKIGDTFQEIDEEQFKECKRIQENKETCDLLAALYPYEMAKMEAALASSSLEKEKEEVASATSSVTAKKEKVEEEEEFILIDADYVSDDDVSSDEDDEPLNYSNDPNSLAIPAQYNFIRKQLDIYKFKNISNFLKSRLPTKLCNYKSALDSCRSSYPINGFPLQKIQLDKEGKEIESDDVAYIEIDKKNLPKNFALFGLEGSV